MYTNGAVFKAYELGRVGQVYNALRTGGKLLGCGSYNKTKNAVGGHLSYVYETYDAFGAKWDVTLLNGRIVDLEMRG